MRVKLSKKNDIMSDHPFYFPWHIDEEDASIWSARDRHDYMRFHKDCVYAPKKLERPT